MNNFIYQNPTKVIFGKGSISHLANEVLVYGKKVLLVYGGESIKRNGIFHNIVEVLNLNGIEYYELSGVKATLDDVYKGIKICKENNIDVVLGIGGGSCIDSAKSIGLGAAIEDDIWDCLNRKVDYSSYRSLPVGAIVTLAASGAEVDSQSEIDNLELKQHGALGGSQNTYPKFAILDPEYTYSVSDKMTAYSGACTITQILEQYVNLTENTPIQDGFMETIIKTCIDSLRVLKDNPKDYYARANMMWASSLACNRILGRGKATTWQVGGLCGIVQKVEHVSYIASTAIVLPKYLMVHSYDQTRILKKLAINVFNVSVEGKSDIEIAQEGAKCMQDFFNEIGIETTYSEMGINVNRADLQEYIEEYAKKTNQLVKDVEKMIDMSL